MLVTIVVTLTSDEREVMFEANVPVDHDLVPKGIYTFGGNAGVVIMDPTGRERALGLAAYVVPTLLFIAVFWFMRGIARSVRYGDPFTRENVRRLRAIGVLLTAGALAVYFIAGEVQSALSKPYERSPFEPVTRVGLLPGDTDFPDVEIMVGLGAFVLAQVFAHGVRLREEVEATI